VPVLVSACLPLPSVILGFEFEHILKTLCLLEKLMNSLANNSVSVQ